MPSRTAFDPAAAAATIKKPTKPAKSVTPPPPEHDVPTAEDRSARTASQLPASALEIIRAKARENAELIVAADNRLTELARDPSTTNLPLEVSITDLRLFAAGGFQIESQHQLLHVLEIRRAALKVRDELGGSIDNAIDDAEKDLAKALERERTVRAEVADLADDDDEAEAPIASAIRRLQLKLKKFVDARVAAEGRVRTIHSQIATLERLAPSPVRRLVEDSRRRLFKSERASRLRGLDADIPQLEKLVNGRLLANGFNHASTNGQLDGFVSRYCPDASRLVKGDFCTRTEFDQSKVMKALADVQAVTLPAMKAERDQLIEVLQDAEKDILEPLRDWVAAGELTVELVTAAAG